MAETHNTDKTTSREDTLAVVLGLLTPLIVIVLVLALISWIQNANDSNAPITEQAVLQNIAPVAELAVTEVKPAKIEKTGEEVFNAVCSSCHTNGDMGAPKFKSQADWAPLLKKGFEQLTANAINGIRNMPRRGGNPDLSDAEVARAVAYMANSGGADFKAPEVIPSAASAAAIAPAAESAAPAQASPTAAADSSVNGKSVYESSCSACHGSGVAGAPKLGDKAAWGERMRAGKEALYASAINGKGAMHGKGGNASLSDDEVKAAVDYMTRQAN